MVLDLTALLFLARVLGQLGVYLGILPFLPPMEQWQSGLLDYPVLFSSQLLILAFMTLVRSRLAKKGWLLSRGVARLLHPLMRMFALMYAAVMGLRLILWIWLQDTGFEFPGGWIPPVFHLVLALYIFTMTTCPTGEAKSA
jgi:hypothetical protein